MIPRPPRVPRTDTLCPYPTRFRSVRNAPEKVFVLDFPEFMPPTMVTRSLDAVKDFQARHGAVVIKPLHGNGGKAVFRVDADGANLGALVELFGQVWPEPFMIQQFLPSVSQGDKRIVLVDGEVAGAINRKPGDRKSPRLNSSH